MARERSFMERNVATRPWKRIVRTKREGWADGIYGMQFRSYRVIVTFECGHEQHYKGSQAPKGERARCRYCPSHLGKPVEVY